MEDLGFAVDETVDITDVVCPVTFVKTKVALEELDDGQILQVHMNDGEPVQNVPRSVKDEGHHFPADSVKGSLSPGRWRRIRPCCFWMSRSRPSMRRCARSCVRGCGR